MKASPLPLAWARLFMHAAARAGVRDVVVSPGSRSTPLALAAHESASLRSHFIVDERSAAFFALGQARVTGRPTMLVCTSGTAGAHYFPAVIEASMSGVPLLVVTADRPWELQQTGASQTIDQTRLFGAFARSFIALGAPEPDEAALRAVARAAAQAVFRALAPEPGPVQVNAPFRKPLEPAPLIGDEPWLPAYEALMRAGPTRAKGPIVALDPAALADVARIVETAERGLIVCGPAPAHGDLDARRREVTALARATGFPVLAESTSQLRFGALSHHTDPPNGRAPIMISAFDALLRAPAFRKRPAPDAIIELGAPPTSAGYSQLLADNPRCPRVVVTPIGWTDPSSTAAVLVHADVQAFCAALLKLLTGRRERATAWSHALASADESARAVIEAVSADIASSCAITSITDPPTDSPTLTEAAVARAVVDACPPESILVLGNSSPVRDVDTHCASSSKSLRVLHQRGAAGIDGLVSGAAGARSVSPHSVTLLLGDLSLLHDLGGLALARSSTTTFVLVVVNNSGGRIFEQLPIANALADQPATFERCFATPQPIDFAAAAATFGIPFERASTSAAFTAALARAHASSNTTLIEAVVPAHDAAERAALISARIDELFRPSKQDHKDQAA